MYNRILVAIDGSNTSTLHCARPTLRAWQRTSTRCYDWFI